MLDQIKPMTHRLAVFSVTLFALFMSWIVFMADTGRHFFFFDLAHSFPYGDKVGHFFLFGFFSLLANLGFRLKGGKTMNLFLPYGSLLVFCLAATEEASQYFFATRTCDLNDLAADFVGIVVFSILLYGPLLKYWTRRKPRSSSI